MDCKSNVVYGYATIGQLAYPDWRIEADDMRAIDDIAVCELSMMHVVAILSPLEFARVYTPIP